MLRSGLQERGWHEALIRADRECFLTHGLEGAARPSAMPKRGSTCFESFHEVEDEDDGK